MDTARVEIEKLQYLNDRIQQTIDALNQVRFSVYGIQQWPVPSPVLAGAGYGLSHSGYAPVVGPSVGQAWAQPMIPSIPRQNPWAYAQGGGLSHSGFDPYRAATIDPFTYGRLLQTFPFLGTDPTRRMVPIY